MSKFSKLNHKNSKLSPAAVMLIRERYANGESQGALARDLKISIGQIGRIVRGEAWVQLPVIPTKGDWELAQELDRLKREGKVSVDAVDAATPPSNPPATPLEIAESAERVRKMVEGTGTGTGTGTGIVSETTAIIEMNAAVEQALRPLAGGETTNPNPNQTHDDRGHSGDDHDQNHNHNHNHADHRSTGSNG